MRTPKFTQRDVEIIKAKLASGISLRDLAKDLSTSVVTLMKIKKGLYVPNGRTTARDNIAVQGDLFVDRTDSGPGLQQTEPHSTD